MNTLKLNKLTYIFQDHLLKKKMLSLKNFKFKVCRNFFIPIDQLEKIYAFIETMQQHPKCILLIHPLKYVFEWFLVDINFEKYLMEYIDELNKRPYLLSAKYDMIYKDKLNNNIISLSESESFKIPAFYINNKKKF